MALSKTYSFPGNAAIIGMQAIEPINYASDQTVSSATGGVMKAARGIWVTTAGTLSIQTKGNSDVKSSVSFDKGIWPIEITGVISAGSATLVGWYYF